MYIYLTGNFLDSQVSLSTHTLFEHTHAREFTGFTLEMNGPTQPHMEREKVLFQVHK